MAADFICYRAQILKCSCTDWKLAMPRSTTVSSASATRKRVHADQDHDEESSSEDIKGFKAADLERHEDLWYEDGNIVISSGKVAFRVHKSILSRHSPTLAKALTPAPKSEQLDGCPVVRLSDAVEDITNLLSVLYYSKKEAISSFLHPRCH